MAVGDSGKNVLPTSPSALKNFLRSRRKRLTCFSDVSDSAESKNGYFQAFPKSLAYTGLICVKTLEPNISTWAPLISLMRTR
jgi:hypothetical protein